jgi:protein-arginine kinase activator protein McsA
VEDGLGNIKDFFTRIGHERGFRQSNEVRVLKRFAREIRRKLPVDPLARLRRKLDRAVKDERYEEAAKLRDKIASMQPRPDRDAKVGNAEH